METENRFENEKTELRARLTAALEKAKDGCERLQDKTVAAARATDEAIRRDNQIAALPREKVVEMMRGLVQKRFDRFERTGDATGITTIGIKRPSTDPGAEGAAE